MRIAVNTRFLQKDKLEGYGYYIHELMQRITINHPEHQFLFLFDREFDDSFIYNTNIIAKAIGPKARHPLSFRYWYDIQFTRAAKKFKADVIVSLDGFCSLTSKIPQILAVHDLAYLHYPDFIPWYHLWFYKLYQKKFLLKAKHIVTVSEFSKQDIISNFKIPTEKIAVVPNGIRNNFKTLSYEQKDNIKNEHTLGNEYFLAVGGIHPRKNILQLLKAFSQFKKWQQSNMKLVIAGRLAWQYETFIEKLKSYKYRNDVVLIGYINDNTLAELMGSAYALVYPSLLEGFGVPIIEAMQSGTPVITSNTSSMPEVGGDAALYANPNDVDDLAKQMMLIYKDEKLRNNLIEKGLIRAKQFSWDVSAIKLWELIEIIGKK
jgi:glycosyltransferase involved in cell wall biosynthesis